MAEVKLVDKGSSKSLFISIVQKDGSRISYGTGCGFKEVVELSDSSKLSLIKSLLGLLSDTSYYYGNVKPLSYRYKGRNNKLPESIVYNVQIESLMLINYISFSSEAIFYSPFPVLFDKRRKKEISTAGKELNFVIEKYKEWFKSIEPFGFKNYSFPLLSKKYEWYGSLFSKQKIFSKQPQWDTIYNCPKRIHTNDD